MKAVVLGKLPEEDFKVLQVILENIDHRLGHLVEIDKDKGTVFSLREFLDNPALADTTRPLNQQCRIRCRLGFPPQKLLIYLSFH